MPWRDRAIVAGVLVLVVGLYVALVLSVMGKL